MSDQESDSVSQSDSAPQFTSVSEAARVYFKMGWITVPVHFQSKDPIKKGWAKQEVTEENIPQLFADEQMNIGIIDGPRSGGIVDVDLSK
jgi:hypothetical protein